MHGETSNSVRYNRRGQADSTAIQTVAVVKSDIGMRTAFLVSFVLSSLSLPIHHVHFRPVALIGYAFVTMPVNFAQTVQYRTTVGTSRRLRVVTSEGVNSLWANLRVDTKDTGDPDYTTFRWSLVVF